MSSSVFGVSDGGVFGVETARTETGELTATVSVSDEARGREAVAVSLSVRFVEGVDTGEDAVSVVVGHDYTGELHEVAASGGSGEYVYAVVETVDSLNRGLGFAVDGDGVLSLSDALVSTSTVSVVVEVSDARYRSLSSSRLTVVVRTGGVAEWSVTNGTVAVGASAGTELARLVLRDYTTPVVETDVDGLFGFGDNLLTLSSSALATGVYLATAVVSDRAHSRVPTVTLVYMLSVLSGVTAVDPSDPDKRDPEDTDRLFGSERLVTVAPSFSGDLLTVSLVGGLSPYGYALLGSASGYDVSSGGVLNVSSGNAPSAGTTATLTVRGSDSLGSFADATVRVVGATDIVVPSVSLLYWPLEKAGQLTELTVSGGVLPYRYEVEPSSVFGVRLLSGSRVGRLRVETAQTEARDVVATVSVLDAARGRVAVTALVTVRFYDGLSFAENPVSVVVGSDYTGPVHAVSVLGGSGDYGYSVALTVGSSSGEFAVDAGGVLRLSSPLVDRVTMSVVVAVSDGELELSPALLTVVVRTGGTAEWRAISSSVLVGAAVGTEAASLSLRGYSEAVVETELDGLFGFGDDRLLTLSVSAATVGAYLATAVVSDGAHPLAGTVTLVYTLSVVSGVTAVDPLDPEVRPPTDPNAPSGSNRLVTVAPTFSGDLLTVSLVGGALPYRYELLGVASGYEVDSSGGVLSVLENGAPSAGTTATMTVRGTGRLGSSADTTVRVVGATDIVVGAVGLLYAGVGETAALVTLEVSGGVAPYGYALSSSVFGVSDAGVFGVETARTETGELTATVSVSDEARGRVAVAVSLSVRFVEGVDTGEAAVSVVVGHDYTGELHSVVASGGSGKYVYAVVQTMDALDRGLGFAVDGDGVLSLSDALVSTSTVSVVVAVSDRDYRSLWSSRLTVVIRTGGTAEWRAIVTAAAAEEGTEVARLVLRDYTTPVVETELDDLFGFGGNLLTLAVSVATVGTYSATAVVSDSAHPRVPTVTLVYTLSVVSWVTVVDPSDPDKRDPEDTDRLFGSERLVTVAPSFSGELLTVSLVGGLPPYGYALLGVASGYDVSAGGVLNVAEGSAPSAGTTVTVTVRGTDSLDGLGSSADATVRVVGATDIVVPSVSLLYWPLEKAGQLTELTVSGGVLPYRYGVEPSSVFGVRLLSGSRVGRLRVETAQSEARDVTATVSVLDAARGRVAVTVLATVRFYEVLSFAENPVEVVVAADYTGPVHEVAASGGSGDYGYSVALTVGSSSGEFAVDAGGVLRLSSPLVDRVTVSVVVAVSDGELELSPASLTVVVRTGGTAEWRTISASVLVGAAVGTEAASLVLRGYSDAVVETELDGLFGFGGNVLTLSGSPTEVGSHLATAVVSDGDYPLAGTVTLVYTLSVVSGVTVVDPLDPTAPPDPDSGAPSGSNRLVTVAPTFSGDLLTVSLVGGALPYSYSLLGEASGYAVDGSGGVLSVLENGAPSAGTTATMTVVGTGRLGSSAEVTVRVVGAADIVVGAVGLLYAGVGETAALVTLEVSGGVAPYGYALSSSVFGVSDAGVFEVVTARTETGELTATVSVSDEARGRVAVAVSLSVQFVEGVGVGEAAVSVVVGHDYTGELHSVVASGGSGEYVYALVQTVDALDRGLGFVVDDDGVLSLSDALVSTSTVSVVVEVSDGDYRSLLPSRLTVVVRTGGVAEWAAISAAVAVGASAGTRVASLVLRDYSSSVEVETELDDLFGFGGNVLTLSVSAATVGAYLATAVVSDGAHPRVGTVTLVYTLSVVSGVTVVDPLDPPDPTAPPTDSGAPSGSSRSVTVAPAFFGELLTVSLVGGLRPYGYALVDAVSGYGVDATAGVLSVSSGNAPSAGTTATLTVRGSDSLGSFADATVRVVGAPDIVVTPVPLLYSGLNERPFLATLTVTGGVGKYRYGVESTAVFGINQKGRLRVGTAQTVAQDVVATISVLDEARGRVAVTVLATVRFYDGLSFAENPVSVVVGSDYTGPVHAVSVLGGSGDYGYSVALTVGSSSGEFAVDAGGVLRLSSPLVDRVTVSVVVAVSDGELELSPASLTVVVRTGGTAEWRTISAAVLVGAAVGTEVASLVLQGYSDAVVETELDDLFGFGDDRLLTLSVGAATVGAYLATAVVSDGTHPLAGTVTLVYTLSVVSGVTAVDPLDPEVRPDPDPNVLSGSNRLVTVAPTFSGELLTVSLVGGALPYVYELLGEASGYEVDSSGGVLSVLENGAPSAGTTATMTVVGTGRLGSSAEVTVRVVGAADIVVGAVGLLYAGVGETAALVTLEVSGGVAPYGYALSSSVFGVSDAGVFEVVTARTETGELTATVSVSDEARGRVAVAVSLSVRFVEGVDTGEVAVSVVVGHDYTGELHSVAASGGSGEYGYALVQTVDALDRGLGFEVDGNGVLSLSDALTVSTSTVSVVVAVSDTLYRSLWSSRLTVVVRTGGVAEWVSVRDAVAVGAPVGTEVASLVLRDYSAVVVETELDDLFGFGGNSLTLSLSAATVGAYLATAVVSDGEHPRVGTVTLVYTLSVVSGVTVVDPEDPTAPPTDSGAPSGSERLVTVAPTFFGELLTVALAGGLPPYGYALLGSASGYDVSSGGVLNVSSGNAPSAGTTATMTVRGSDSLGSFADATVRVVGATDIVVEAVPLLYVLLGDTPRFAALTVTGGVGDYRYGVESTAVFGINDNGRLKVKVSPTEVGDVVATISVLDEARGRVAVTVLATVRFYDGLSFAENPVSVVVGPDYTGPVHTVSVLAGSGDYGYSVALTVGSSSGEFAVDAGGVLRLSSPLVDRVTVSVVVAVSDGELELSPASLTVVVRTGGTAEWRTISASVLVGAAVGTEVASLVLQGYSDATVETELDDLFGFGGNVLTLSSSAARVGAYLATAVVSDGDHPLAGTVTLVYTLSVVSGVTAVDPLDPTAPPTDSGAPFGSNRLVTVAPTFSGELLTVSLVGGALPYGYSLSEAVSGYGVDATAGVLSVSVGGAPSAGTTATMTVVGTGRLGSSAEVTVRVVGATDIVVGAVELLYAGVGETAALVTLEVSGGVAPYGYALSSSVFGVSDEGVFEVLTARTETGELTATVSVSDEARGRVAVAVLLSVRFVEGVDTGEAAVSVVVGHDYTGELHSVVASGGSGEYVYALVQTVDSLDRGLGFAVDAEGVLSLSDALTVTSTVSVVVAVSDGDYRSLVPASLTVVVRTGGVAEWAAISAAVAVGAPVGTEVASLVLRDYSVVVVETELDDLFGFGDNVLTLSVSAATVGAYLATAVVRDGEHPRVGTVTLVYTLSVVSGVTAVDPEDPTAPPTDSGAPSGSDRLVTVAPTFSGELLTVSLVGGLRPYGYALVDAVSGYGVDATAGVLSVSSGNAPSAGTTATMTVRGSDSLGSFADATVRVVGATDIVVTPVPLLYSGLNERPFLATLTVTGGVGKYRYGVESTAVFGINQKGRLRVGTAQSEVGDVTATISVSDEARGRVAVTALVTVRFYDGLSFAENPVSVVVGSDYTGPVHTVSVLGGSGDYGYSVASTVGSSSGRFAVDAAGVLSLSSPLVDRVTVSVVVAVSDGDLELSPALLTVVVRTGGTAEWRTISASVLVGAAVGTEVASLVLRGYSDAVVETELDGLFGFGGNVLTLSSSAATVGAYLATAVVSDGAHPLAGTVTLVYTLSVVSGVTAVDPLDPTAPPTDSGAPFW